MIPTVILVGILAGLLPHRHLIVAALSLALLWPLTLQVSGTIDSPRQFAAAMGLAAANAFVGIGITRAVMFLIRLAGRERPY